MGTARNIDENAAPPPRSRRTTTLAFVGPAAGAALGAGAMAAWTSAGTTLLVSGLIPLLLVLGVVYPAVWSRKASRRKAALDVLRLLFTGKAPDNPPIPHSCKAADDPGSPAGAACLKNVLRPASTEPAPARLS